MSKLESLLNWVANQVYEYPKVEVTNFTTSFADGLAFCALTHSQKPDLVPFEDFVCFKKVNSNGIFCNIVEDQVHLCL